MGSAALGITILTAQMTGTGRQRKRQVTIGCAIHNPTAENLEHVTLRVLPVSLREFQRPVRYGVSPAYWVKPRPRADADGDGQPGKNGWSG